MQDGCSVGSRSLFIRSWPPERKTRLLYVSEEVSCGVEDSILTRRNLMQEVQPAQVSFPKLLAEPWDSTGVLSVMVQLRWALKEEACVGFQFGGVIHGICVKGPGDLTERGKIRK